MEQDLLNKIWNKLLDMDEKISEMKDDITTLKVNYSELKEDVSTLKTNYSELKDDVSTLKTNYSELKNDVSILKVNYSEMEYILQLVYESTVRLENSDRPNIQKALKNLDKSSSFESRILSLENITKSHSKQISLLRKAT